MSEQCETCQWWEETTSGDPWDLPSMYGDDGRAVYTDDYERVAAPGRWGTCTKVAEFGPRKGSDRFYVIDGSEYAASLQCRSDFGCVEHEPGPIPESQSA